MGTKRTRTIHDPLFLHVLPWFTDRWIANSCNVCWKASNSSGRSNRSQHHCASKGRNATSQVHNAWAVWRSLFFFWVCGGGAPITLERASKQIASNSYYNHNCYDTLKLDRSLDAISLFFPATWRRDTRTTTHTCTHIDIHVHHCTSISECKNSQV